MSKQETGNKLNGRDFINIGIYAAIYFVIVMALAMTGLIPIFSYCFPPWSESLVAFHLCFSLRK